MYTFISAFDNYMSIFDSTEKKSYEYDTIEGELRFVKINSTDIILNSIYVKPELRGRRILEKFLFHVVKYIKQNKLKHFWIVDVLSKILYGYLLRFKYNDCRFKLHQKGFFLI
jgi:predicted GNAT family acetyltransferase